LLSFCDMLSSVFLNQIILSLSLSLSLRASPLHLYLPVFLSLCFSTSFSHLIISVFLNTTQTFFAFTPSNTLWFFVSLSLSLSDSLSLSLSLCVFYFYPSFSLSLSMLVTYISLIVSTWKHLSEKRFYHQRPIEKV